MLDLIKKSECCGCSACKNICPRNAIFMQEDEHGFLYPVIDNDKCIKCGLCKKVCPVLNVEPEKQTKAKAYAAINKNDEIRKNSSSGGMFFEIAKLFIQENGVVFGAAFDEKFNVFHMKVQKEDELKKIMGSKYIQSNINDTYKHVKKYLCEGKKVLYTGTPCQIEGLYCYLKKDYENLYTQDLICHGVPSKKVWKKYLEYREKNDLGKPKKVFFRNKENLGWSKYEVLFEYDDKKTNIEHNKDSFMKIFLSDVCLRPSCYECKFKKRNRISDITLADFWGIDNVLPEMNDEKGTSLLIIHSEKGKEIFGKLPDNIIYKEVDFEEAISGNKSMIKSPDFRHKNDEIYKDLDKLTLKEIAEKYKKKNWRE